MKSIRELDIKDINFKQGFTTFYRKNGYVFAFVLLVVIATSFNPHFLSTNDILTLLNQTAVKGVIAVGLVFAVTAGLFDLSVGSQVGLIAGIGVMLYNQYPSVPVLFMFAIGAGCVLGLINGLLVAHLKMPTFIATLATQAAFRSIITQIGASGPITINRNYLDQFNQVANGSILGIPNLVFLFIVVTVIGIILFNRTKFGRYVTAIGSNVTAAKLAGINVKKIQTICFIITGITAGLSAFILTARLTSITAANAGVNFEFDGFAAIAIGGTSMVGGRGKILGAFFGMIMLQMIETIQISAAVPPFLDGLVKGIIIVVAVLMQNQDKTT